MRIKPILFLLLFLGGSCSEKIFTGDVNCDECYTEKPDKSDLVIDVTINYKYPEVPIVVYRGDMENQDIIATDTATYTPYYVYVPVGETYSVRAEYNQDSITTFAVDGTHLKALSVSDACDSKCYVIANDKLDVRLKKEFQ
jgi:hypothetical protein